MKMFYWKPTQVSPQARPLVVAVKMDVSTLRTVKKKINLWSYMNIIHVPLHFFLDSACAIGDSFSVSIQSGSSSSS